jgi:ketosteroid isomerase-like protein
MTDYGRPTAIELVDAVREFLDSDVRDATNGQVNFHARVAANVLRIVRRELSTERGSSERPSSTERGLSERPSSTERGSSERPWTTERGLSERPSSTERGLSERPWTTVDEKTLVAAVRDGEFDDNDAELMTALRSIVYDRLSVAHPGYALQSVADRLFAAIEAGDVEAVAAMWSDDVTVWHSGEKRPSEKARAMRVIDWFVAATADRHYAVLDRQFFDGGFVQQHVLSGKRHDGTAYSLRVGIIIRVRPDGLITRIDKYLDPADLAPLLK